MAARSAAISSLLIGLIRLESFVNPILSRESVNFRGASKNVGAVVTAVLVVREPPPESVY